jgi:hypothetical protein
VWKPLGAYRRSLSLFTHGAVRRGNRRRAVAPAQPPPLCGGRARIISDSLSLQPHAVLTVRRDVIMKIDAMVDQSTAARA